MKLYDYLRSARRSILMRVRRGARCFGFDVVRYAGEWPGLDRIEPPSTIVDVGVAFGTPVLYNAFPDAYLILVEPVPAFKDHLRRDVLAKRPGRLFECAAGSVSSTSILRLEDKYPLRSSLLDRTALSRSDSPITELKVEVKRLDTILTSWDLGSDALLKVDAEGFELEVLAGLGQLISCFRHLIVECNIQATYEGGVTVEELLQWTADAGYRLKSLLSATLVAGEYRYADILFERIEFLEVE